MAFPGDFEARLRRAIYLKHAKCFDEIWENGPPCGTCITCKAKAENFRIGVGVRSMGDPAPRLPVSRFKMSPRNVHFDEDLEAIEASWSVPKEKRRQRSYRQWLQETSPRQYAALQRRQLKGPVRFDDLNALLAQIAERAQEIRIPQPPPGKLEQ